MAAYAALKRRAIATRTVDTALTPLHAGAQKDCQEVGLRIAATLRSSEAK